MQKFQKLQYYPKLQDVGGQSQSYTKVVKGLYKGRNTTTERQQQGQGPGLSNRQRRFAMTDQTIHVCEPTSHWQQLPALVDSPGTANKRVPDAFFFHIFQKPKNQNCHKKKISFAVYVAL